MRLEAGRDADEARKGGAEASLGRDETSLGTVLKSGGDCLGKNISSKISIK